MERSAYALATGLFVVLLTLGALAAARWLQGPEVERHPYQVVTSTSVAGLSAFSKVFFRGVQVGQVTAIRFAEDNSRDIVIDIELDPQLPITVNTYAVLKSQGLTGLAFVELLDDGPANAPALATSAKTPGTIPMQPSLLESFQTMGQGIAEQVQQLVININTLFTPDAVARVGRIMENVEQISARTDELLTASRPALDRLAPLLDQGDATLAEAGSTLAAARQALERVQAVLHHAETITARTDASLAEVGEQFDASILPEIETTLAAFRRAAERFENLAASLDRNPGALLTGPSQPSPGPGEPGYSGD